MSILSLHGTSRIYNHKGILVKAVDDISAEFRSGEMAVIIGSSGSGKSTLLLMLGGMMKPSSGKVQYNGESVYGWQNRRLKKYRGLEVGFIFQKFFLLPYLSVKDNVLISASIEKSSSAKPAHIEELASNFGLLDRLNHKPGELSVGEQQRVALMRALIRNPDIILADEPTGNLDPANSGIVFETLQREACNGRIVIMVTHNHNIDNGVKRIITLEKGKIIA